MSKEDEMRKPIRDLLRVNKLTRPSQDVSRQEDEIKEIKRHLQA